jgi:small ligand-binding sensory domain FIST
MAGLNVGVALSQNPDAEAAARDASLGALEQAGLKTATWALCFFTGHHMQEAEALRTAILHETGCKSFAGCSSMGVIAQGEEVESGPALALMVGDAAVLESHSALLPDTGEGLGRFANLDRNLPGASLLIALPDSLQVDMNSVRSRMLMELPGLPVFGAGATDDGRAGLSLQMGMEGVSNRSISTLGLFGEFDLAVGITQSCAPLGDPHFITASRENILIELDGRPALQSLIDLGKELDLDDFQQLASQVMFGFPLDEENPRFSGKTCLVRALAGLDQETQGLVIPFPLKNQSSMTFMHRSPGSAEEDMGRMVTEARAELAGPPDCGIYFDCAGRGQGFYGRPGVDIGKISDCFGEFPLIGMYGGFELATALGIPHIYTYTGVLVLLRGRG